MSTIDTIAHPEHFRNEVRKRLATIVLSATAESDDLTHTPDTEGGLLEITVSEIRDDAGQSPHPRHIDDAALEAVRALCASLHFNADGRKAVAAYRWYKESTPDHRSL